MRSTFFVVRSVAAGLLVAALAAMVVGLSTNPALATDKSVDFNIPVYDVWWDAFATWLPPGEPGNGDAVYLNRDYTVHIRYGGEECSYLYLGDPDLGAGHLIVNAPAGTWFTVHQREWVGVGGSGTFELLSGWHSCPNISLGVFGGSGSFSMEIGTNLSAGFLYIGGAESTMIQNGGTASCSDALVLGSGSSEGGNYGLYGGLLMTQRVDIGGSGHGVFLQTGGEHDVFGDLNLAVQTGSAGTYRLTGGTLDVWGAVTTGAGASTIALDGGMMTVSGMTTVGTLRLGTDSGTEGDHMLGANGMIVNDLTVGSRGLGFFYQAVAVNTVHTALHVGREAGGEGTYALSGTGLLLAPLAYVGERGKGTVNHSNGEAGLTQLTLGLEQAGDGYYNLSGDGNLVAGTIIVGEHAHGKFQQSGGTNTVNSNLFIGNSSGSFGQYLHQAGSCNVTGSVMVGNYAGSVGDYTLNGTGHLVTAYMQVGTLGTGTFHQDGGTSEIANDLWVGNNGGSQGRCAQTAGQNTVSGTLHMGEQAASQGIYSLDGGGLAAGRELIGVGGVGKFYQNNGENAVIANVYLGRDAGGYGQYELNGGAFSAHDLFIASAGNADMLVTNGQAHFHRIRFGDSAGAHGSLTLRGGTVTIEGGDLSTGSGEGLLVLDGGTLQGTTEWHVTTLDVGHAPGVSVSYTFDSMAIGVSGTETIGLQGAGTVTQPSGSNLIGVSLHIGDANDGLGTIGIGTYNLSGTTSLLSAPEVQLGPRGQGTVNQSGGTLTIAGSLVLSHNSVGSGAFHLTGGSLSANDEVVGGDGVGVFTHSAGTNQVAGTLIIGHNHTTASTYTLSSEGILNAHDEHIGETGKAVFRQENGRNTVIGDIRIGADIGSDGTYQQIAGFVTASCVYVGFVGKGAYEHSGGQVSVTSGLSVGFVAGATGTYTLSGNAHLAAASEAVGDNGGRGTFNHNGGTNSTDVLNLGLTWTTANGSYYLRGGDLTAGAENVGYGSTGLMEQSAGTNTVLGNLTLGVNVNGNGTVNMKGGNLQLNGSMYVGYAGTGAVVQSGGGVYSGWSLYAGYLAGAKGTYTLSQSGLLMAADESIGHAGQGTVNQTDGSNVAASVTLGYAATGIGTYNLSSGTFQANSLVIGKAGAGTFTQTAGSAYGGMITIGDESTATGTLNLNGGDLTAFSLVNRRTFAQTSGMLIAGAVTNEAGATASISGDAFLATDSLSNLGTLTQTGGILCANTLPAVTVDNSGTFTQTGGSFQANLINSGTFNYRGGTFSGSLEHWGYFNMTQSFTAGGGIVNYSYLATAPGCNLTANGSGLDNYGVLSLVPGTSVGGTALNNQPGGLITGAGTIRTTLNNFGTVQTTGSLITTSAASNYGLITLATAQNLLAQGGLANSGVVELTGGGVSGTTFTNQAGGELRGRGSVTALLTNDGGLVHADSTAALVVSNLAGGNLNGGELRIENGATLNTLAAFSSSGTISLKGLNATLTGGAITSSGTICGVGRVANSVYNSGIIRAEGGQLTLAGSGATNTSSGRIEAGAGDTLFYTQGLAANAGTIALTGGVFDTNNHTMTNSGLITGHGTLRTGGLTNSAGKNIGVGSGNLDVLGAATNDGTINTPAGCTTTFYNFVNGSGSFPGTGTVVFLGGFSPGHSPGEAEFGGDLALGGADSLVMELAGESRGTRYDAIDVDGTLALGGTLDVELLYGYTPSCGVTFDLLDWGNLSGEFDAIDLPDLGGGLSWDTSNLYTTGAIGVVPEPATLALVGLGALAVIRRKLSR